MASSTLPPDTDAAPAAEEPPPRTVLLTSLAGQMEMFDQLLGLAKRRIRLFDFDLKQWSLETPARIEQLGSFMRALEGNRLDIVVHDPSHIEARCPRLNVLLQNYSHAMTIYRTGPGAKVATDPLLIIDELHYLHRFHYEQPRAGAGFYCAYETGILLMRFEEIWATGEPGVGGSVLGL